MDPYVYYREGDSVELTVLRQTDIGFCVLINDSDEGLLFFEDVFQPLSPEQRLPGFIKRVRPDGKVDVSLQRPGYRDCEDISEKILSLLKQKSGFLPVGDKSSADTVYDYFGVSKKKYKMAVGKLYKEKRITLDANGRGIRLKSSPQ